MKNMLFIILSMMYSCSGTSVAELKTPPKSAFIYIQNGKSFRGGTAFKLKYKDTVYII